MLYNENYASMMLGCLCNNTELLFAGNYPLSKSDFSPISVHKIVFSAIVSLAEQGAKEVSEIEIDTYLQAFPVDYETFTDSNGLEFVNTIKQESTHGSYEMYYNTIRKLSLLRQLKSEGISIEEFFDEAKPVESETKKLEELSIQAILSAVEAKATMLRNRYDIHYVRDEIKAGEDVEERLEAFKEHPAFGAYLQSGYLSTLWNGWSRGHLLLRAGPSGSGKTRCSVADLVQVGAKEIWSSEHQDFIPNTNYKSSTLYIHTEMNTEKEVEPMFWAAISGVEYRDITGGLTTKEEDRRIAKAGEILKQSNLTITSMPDFTSQSLKRKIKEKVENEGIEYCVFDYMEIQSALSAEFKQTTAVPPREDLVLKSLCSDLKQYAEEFNVGILTGMQLNSEWKSMSYIDESALAGSKAAKNKIDGGSIIIPTSYLKKDMKIIEPYVKRRGVGNNRQPMPNICEFIFKARFGQYGDQRLKLWSYFNRGTFERTDYLITDDANEVVAIQPTVLQEEF